MVHSLLLLFLVILLVEKIDHTSSLSGVLFIIHNISWFTVALERKFLVWCTIEILPFRKVSMFEGIARPLPQTPGTAP